MSESGRGFSVASSAQQPSIVWLVALAVLLGILATFIAGLDFKWQFAAAGLLVFALLAIVSRDKVLFLLIALVLMLPMELKKRFSELDDVLTGAISYYYTSVEALLIVAFAVALTRRDFRDRMGRTFLSLPNVLAVLVVFGAIPSLVNAAGLHLSLWELNRMLGAYLLFFFGLNIYRPGYAGWVVGALIAMGLSQSALGILQGVLEQHLGLQFLGEEAEAFTQVYGQTTVVRASGTIVDPNSYAAALGVLAAIALAVALFHRSIAARLVSILMVAGACVAVVYSFSRSGVIAVLLALVLVLAIGLGTGKITLRPVLLSVLAAILIGAFAWWMVGDRIEARISTQAKEFEARMQSNWVAVNAFSAHPIVGVGLNNFKQVQMHYESPDTLLTGIEVHNLYLLMLAETGLLGTVPFILFVVALYRMNLPLLRSRDLNETILATGLLAGFAGLLVAEVSSFALRLDVTMKLFWLLAGLLFSMRLGELPAISPDIEPDTDIEPDNRG